MNKTSAEIAICGAGIAGISAAYFLAVRHGVGDILLIDERPPLTLTSDKSTECYRNWWPAPGDAMVRLMNRSIDLMEEMSRASRNSFHLNRRGYLYVSCQPGRIPELEAAAVEASALGAGELRLHTSNNSSYQPHHAEGFEPSLDGTDLITAPSLIREHFPYLSKEVAAVLHVRRAGWLSAQQFGMWLLEQARAAGVQLIQGKLLAVETVSGRVNSLLLEDGRRIHTLLFVNAAGPHLAGVGRLLGEEVPVFNELHLKATLNDYLGALPRDTPLVINADQQQLAWSAQERALLSEDPQTAWLLEKLPAGAHTRPEGDRAAHSILLLWDLFEEAVEPRFPPEMDPMAAELAVRGLAPILPGFQPYIEKMPRPFVDGGYYTKTQENRPLVGPSGTEGAYLIGAASGYGIMAAAGMAELLAQTITGQALPEYAPAFSLDRYQDPDYQHMLKNLGDSWQL